MHFGAALRLLRTEAGFSLKALGGMIGVSPAYLSRVEHGHDAPPTADRLGAIAGAFGMDVGLLLDLTGHTRADHPAHPLQHAAGRALVAEVARRRLGPAQIARVIDFISREFPDHGPTANASITRLLTPERVLLGVRVGRLDDAIELGAMRLGGEKASALATALLARERANCSAVGGGLLVPHVSGYAASPAACLLLLDGPLPGATPDGAPIRAVLALVGLPHAPAGLTLLGHAARLAEPALLDRLVGSASGAEVVRALAAFEGVNVA